jgi:thiol:disulfide interchange protein
VLLGFAAWLKGATEATRPGWRIGGSAAAALVAIVAVALTVATAPSSVGERDVAAPRPGDGPQAEAFSELRLAALRAGDRAVFVNLTAAWCITCQVNERIALSSSRVADAFAARGVVYVKGDWTNRDPEVTRLLAAHGRSGVPLYLLYPPDGGEPAVLPQLLTESIVLDALAPLPVMAARPTQPEEGRS